MNRRGFLASVACAALAVGVGADWMGDQLVSDTDALLVNRCTFGAYAANEPWPNLDAHYELESQLEVGLPIMSWFQSWTNGWLTTQARQAESTGHHLLICLEPALDSGVGVPFTDILAGKWDRRLDRFFHGAAQHGPGVTIRFAHEMNMPQYPWSVINPRSSAPSLDLWLDTWRYVVDRQRAVGGNVRWQWCVNSIDIGSMSAESYWPGADYVDVLSMDAYNGFGKWWNPPLKVIQPMYKRLIALHPTAPVWISELGCRPVDSATEPYDRAQWYLDLMNIAAMPRMEAIVFFNQKKEYDWRISTDDVRAPIGNAIRSAQSLAR